MGRTLIRAKGVDSWLTARSPGEFSDRAVSPARSPVSCLGRVPVGWSRWRAGTRAGRRISRPSSARERSYGDYAALLADDEVDAIYVATPHPWHFDWSLRAIRAGKHVLCEKPLTLNHGWSMALVEAARRADVFLMEAYMYRCHPQTKKIVELVRDGAIGTVQHVESSFSFHADFRTEGRIYDAELGGGGILDVGGYPVSMSRLIAGAATGQAFAEPVSVSAVGRIGETGVDEWTTASLEFASGITASVSCGIRLQRENTLRVLGSEGFLVVAEPWLPGATEPTTVRVHRVGADVEEIVIAPQGLYAAEADVVAAHMADRQAPEMSWADTLGNMAALDRWRAEIGLVYPQERKTDMHTVSGPRDAPRPCATARCHGVAKPMSRLVMGVDNQPNLVHASVLFDDFTERGGNAFDTAHTYGNGRLEALFGPMADRPRRARRGRADRQGRAHAGQQPGIRRPATGARAWTGCEPTTWTSTSCTATTPTSRRASSSMRSTSCAGPGGSACTAGRTGPRRATRRRTRTRNARAGSRLRR